MLSAFTMLQVKEKKSDNPDIKFLDGKIQRTKYLGK